MNAITHVFDASNVYGSSLEEQHKLRTMTNGKMKTQKVGRHILPPQNEDKCDGHQKEPSTRCPFRGGDKRIGTTRK